MPILLAALSDPLTALIAIVALLLGVWLIVRGPRSEPRSMATDDAAGGRAPPTGAAGPPADASGKPAAQATTFRHGAIKLGRTAGPAPPKPPPLPATSAPPKLADPPQTSAPAPPAPPAVAPGPAKPLAPAVPASELAKPTLEEPPEPDPEPEPEPAKPPPPPEPELPAWKRRALAGPEPSPSADPGAEAEPDAGGRFKHGAIRFRK